MKIKLDVKKTIDYLIKEANYEEFSLENHELCDGIFEEYRQKSLTNIAKIYKVIYFLKVVSNIQFSNLQHLLDSEDSALDLLFKRMGTDIIGPRTRIDTAQISYLYGNENIDNSWTKKLIRKIDNSFADYPKNMTFFEEIKFRLEQKLNEIKKTDNSESREPEIFTISQILKLSKRVQLSIQGFIHEASAMRRLHFVATEIEKHLNDSEKKDNLLRGIKDLAKLYQEYNCIDYKFSTQEGMTIGDEDYSPGDVKKLRGKKLKALRKVITDQISDLTPIDFNSNSIFVENLNFKELILTKDYKNHLQAWIDQSVGYFTVKSEINSIFADYDDKLSNMGNRCELAASWAGIIGAVSMMAGGVLTFTPFMPVGQGMVWLGLGLSMIGLGSSVIVTTKGIAYDPIVYGVSPKIKDVILLGILPAGLLAAGGLKFIANQQIMGQFALSGLSFLDSSIKLPMQIKGAFSQRGHIKLKGDEQALRSDAFVIEDITREKILNLARNFLLQKPEKFEHILNLIDQKSTLIDESVINDVKNREDGYQELNILGEKVHSNNSNRFFKSKILIKEQKNLYTKESKSSPSPAVNSGLG